MPTYITLWKFFISIKVKNVTKSKFTENPFPLSIIYSSLYFILIVNKLTESIKN